jgi:hypothetical protein
MSDHDLLPETPTPESDVKGLGRELAASYRSVVDYYRKKLGLDAGQAVARAEEPNTPEEEWRTLDAPAADVTWWQLEDLARSNPDLAVRRWQEIKAEALEELRSGHRAGAATEGYRSTPMQRARFLAIRDELVAGWQPRNGVERQLLDTMAQAQTAGLFWLERLSQRFSVEAARAGIDEEEHGWETPRVDEQAALEQAAAMVDRFNRIFLRTLRALRDLRRWPAVVVQNACQINVGSRQVNVNQ